MCHMCATPRITLSPRPPCSAHLQNDPLSAFLLPPPSHMPQTPARHSGKEKFIDDKHETKIAFLLVTVGSPPAYRPSCHQPPLCLVPAQPRRGATPKKPQSVPQKAPKNEKSCRPRRAKCQSRPVGDPCSGTLPLHPGSATGLATPKNCGHCALATAASVWGEHNMQKIRRKSGRSLPATTRSPQPTTLQQRAKKIQRQRRQQRRERREQRRSCA